MQCCIHGDAKDANMMFDGKGGVSMYDFQYCGRAPPSVSCYRIYVSHHVHVSLPTLYTSYAHFLSDDMHIG